MTTPRRPSIAYSLGLSFLLLLCISSCQLTQYYEFEEMGGFKFPESFVTESYVSSSSIMILKGVMDTTDARRIVNTTAGFEQDWPPGIIIPFDEFKSTLSKKFVMRKQDRERKILYHIDISTGKFDGYVYFIFASGGGTSAPSL